MSTNTCNVGSKSQKFGYIGKIHEPIIGFEVAIRFVSSCKEDNRKGTYHGSRELEAFGFEIEVGQWNVEGWSGFTRDLDATGCNAFFSSSIISSQQWPMFYTVTSVFILIPSLMLLRHLVLVLVSVQQALRPWVPRAGEVAS